MKCQEAFSKFTENIPRLDTLNEKYEDKPYESFQEFFLHVLKKIVNFFDHAVSVVSFFFLFLLGLILGSIILNQ